MRREPPSAERHARWCERDLIVTYSMVSIIEEHRILLILDVILWNLSGP